MVAKSYQNLQQIGTPYSVNGRMYVKVAAPTGPKQVRWYTENEYRCSANTLEQILLLL